MFIAELSAGIRFSMNGAPTSVKSISTGILNMSAEPMNPKVAAPT